MTTECEMLANQTQEELIADVTPPGSIAEAIVWFDRHWNLDGYSFGISINGQTISTTPVGESEGLKDKVLFICDSKTGDCCAMPQVKKTEYRRVRPAPLSYLEALDKMPERIIGSKFLFCSIVTANGNMWCNAYEAEILQKICEVTGCKIHEAPRKFVEKLYDWRITKNNFAYGYNVWTGYISHTLRPTDKCGECGQNKRLKKCTACKFNMLCRACKCSKCDLHKLIYEKVSTTSTA